MTVLGLFFTRGVSLEQWVESGLFDREVRIYRMHLAHGRFSRIFWFTYGASDHEVAAKLVAEGRLPGEILVVPRPAWLGCFGRGASLAYSFLLPLLAGQQLRQCSVFKTNQMDGALAAVWAAARFRRPLYVRTGYTLSLFVDRIHARNPLRRAFASLTERIAFRRADIVSVSSHFDRDYVARRYGLAAEVLTVVGNYIDTDEFSPRHGVEQAERVIFVGRLSAQKNLPAAIEACAIVGVGLDIVGDGEERDSLRELAATAGIDMRWLGVIANDHLPEVLNGCRYFILPSLWEGMPKSLLEAMASGRICIGNDTSGINEVIEDGVTGYLAADASSASLAEAIGRAMQGNHAAIVAAGRAFVCKHYSLDAIAAKEAAIFSSLLSGGHGSLWAVQ